LGTRRLRDPADFGGSIHVRAHSEISAALENGWHLDAITQVVISALRALLDPKRPGAVRGPGPVLHARRSDATGGDPKPVAGAIGP
jgi:hypothetical protein